MDQESFRQLLQKPSAASSGTSSTHVRGSLLSAATASAGKKKTKAADASQPAFKPRTLKKNAKGEAYRDRAAERRLGTNNDYAQVCVFSGFLRFWGEGHARDLAWNFRAFLPPRACILIALYWNLGRGIGGGLRASECRERGP